MNIAYAKRCAARLVDWLKPHCERIEVAGSIRRGRPLCSDVDLLVIPKKTVERDIFGVPVRETNNTWREIDRRASADKWKMLRAGADIVSWVHAGVQVDVFFTEPQYWGTMLLCKTGSKEHNIWLSNYAISLGGKWHPTHGLYIRGKRVSDTEEAIYEAIGVAFVPPERREIHLLPHAGLVRASTADLRRMA